MAVNASTVWMQEIRTVTTTMAAMVAERIRRPLDWLWLLPKPWRQRLRADLDAAVLLPANADKAVDAAQPTDGSTEQQSQQSQPQ
mmetsp:Transcript_20609/g.58597  ORF Transcript_20609/g.58597 Transcript_20609/m.58597 type:complete len:85 (+) Transcript_20609:2009-2263(+)